MPTYMSFSFGFFDRLLEQRRSQRQGGLFTFEVHPVAGFPASALPAETQLAAHMSSLTEVAT
jgi:hypothetical protein